MVTVEFLFTEAPLSGDVMVAAGGVESCIATITSDEEKELSAHV
jgi:hypothetical protein